MDFILNIGLKVGVTGSIAAHVAKEIVVANDFLIKSELLIQSDTEPTLVLEVTSMSRSPMLVSQQLHRIAADLQQDCIAVYRPATGGGALAGPGRAKWGSFDPQYFFMPNGRRLAPVGVAA